MLSAGAYPRAFGVNRFTPDAKCIAPIVSTLQGGHQIVQAPPGAVSLSFWPFGARSGRRRRARSHTRS